MGVLLVYITCRRNLLEEMDVGLGAPNVGIDLRKLGVWAAELWAAGIQPPAGGCNCAHLFFKGSALS